MALRWEASRRCVYTDALLGCTSKMQVDRRAFYEPDDILCGVLEKVTKAKVAGRPRAIWMPGNKKETGPASIGYKAPVARSNTAFRAGRTTARRSDAPAGIGMADTQSK